MILGNEDDVRPQIEFQLSLLRLLTQPHEGKLGVNPANARETAESRKLEQMASLVPER